MRVQQRLQARMDRRLADRALRYAEIIAAGPTATDENLDELLELQRLMGVSDARLRGDLAARERYDVLVPIVAKRHSADARDMTEEELATLIEGEVELAKLVRASPWLFRADDGGVVVPTTAVASGNLPLVGDGSLAFDVQRVRSIRVDQAYTPAELSASFGLGPDLVRASLPRMPGDAELYFGASVLAWANGCDRTFRVWRRLQLNDELQLLGRPLPRELLTLKPDETFHLPTLLSDAGCQVMRGRIETHKEYVPGLSTMGRISGEDVASWVRGVEARRTRATAELARLDEQDAAAG